MAMLNAHPHHVLLRNAITYWYRFIMVKLKINMFMLHVITIDRKKWPFIQQSQRFIVKLKLIRNESWPLRIFQLIPYGFNIGNKDCCAEHANACSSFKETRAIPPYPFGSACIYLHCPKSPSVSTPPPHYDSPTKRHSELNATKCYSSLWHLTQCFHYVF